MGNGLTIEQRDEVRELIENAPLNGRQRAEINADFMPRNECESRTDSIEVKLSNDFTDLAVIKFQNKLILGILSAVGIAILGLVVSQFWG
jgi:hypothetical protein